MNYNRISFRQDCLTRLLSQDEQHIIVTGRGSNKLPTQATPSTRASAGDQQGNSSSTSLSTLKQAVIQKDSDKKAEILKSSAVTDALTTDIPKPADLALEQLAAAETLPVNPKTPLSSALDTELSLLSATPAASDSLQKASELLTDSSLLATSQPPRILRGTGNDRSAVPIVVTDAATSEFVDDSLEPGLEKDEIELALEMMDADSTLETESAQGLHAEDSQLSSSSKEASQLGQPGKRNANSEQTLESRRGAGIQRSMKASSSASGSGGGAGEAMQEGGNAAAEHRITPVLASGVSDVFEDENLTGQVRQVRHAPEKDTSAGQTGEREVGSRAVLQKAAATVAAKLAVSKAIIKAIPASNQQQAISLLLQQYGITLDMPAAALTAANAPVAR